MEKSGISSAHRLAILDEELSRFLKLINGHRKILAAIGEL